MITLRDALLGVAADHQHQVEEHLATAERLTEPAQHEGRIQHRALAFAHQWCALLEAPDADTSQVTELIDAQTRLTASDGRTISGVEEIETWFATTAGAVEHTAHTITGFHVEPGHGEEIHVALDFAWQGLTAAQQAMRARTHHDWTLIDGPGRFPVLRAFRVEIVEPFAPTSQEDALAFLREAAVAAV